MINEIQARKYCNEDISKIENYDKAIADNSQTWCCHHRAEILPCGNFSPNDLKKFGLYWKRPASELVFMLRADHQSMHSKGKSASESTRMKISISNKGKKLSEVTKNKISIAKHGKESNRKGCKLSDSQKLKLSILHKGRHWFNNGSKEIAAIECPKGFVKGRIKKK